MEKIFDKQDIVDMCIGATVLGTGGGGSPELGISLLNDAYDAGKDAKDWDLSTMTGVNYPDLDRARKFLAEDDKRRIGQDPETGEFRILDVETALKFRFIEIAEILVRRYDVVKALTELLSQKGLLTESELKEFLYRPENMKSYFLGQD